MRLGYEKNADGKFIVPYPLQYFGIDRDSHENIFWNPVFEEDAVPMEAFRRSVSELLMQDPESCFWNWARCEILPEYEMGRRK